MTDVVYNGCDFFPPGSWDLCCNSHDEAFAIGGSFIDMVTANVSLGWCVAQTNPFVSAVIIAGVSVGGWFFFEWKFLNGKNLYEVITGKKSDGQF